MDPNEVRADGMDGAQGQVVDPISVNVDSNTSVQVHPARRICERHRLLVTVAALALVSAVTGYPQRLDRRRCQLAPSWALALQAQC
jgi:hypothetical protein